MPNEKTYITPDGKKYAVKEGSESDFLKAFPNAKPFNNEKFTVQKSIYVTPDGKKFEVDSGSESDFLKSYPNATIEKKKESQQPLSSTQSAFSGGGSVFGQKVPSQKDKSNVSGDLKNVGSAFSNIRKDLSSNTLGNFETNVASDLKFSSEPKSFVNKEKIAGQILNEVSELKPQAPIQTQQELDKLAFDARTEIDKEKIASLNVINQYAPEFIENNKGLYDVMSDIHSEPTHKDSKFIFNPSESVRNAQTENIRTGELEWGELRELINNFSYNNDGRLNNKYTNLITNYLWSLSKSNPELANDKLSLLLYKGGDANSSLFAMTQEAYGYFSNVANNALNVLDKYGLKTANDDLNNVYSKFENVSQLLQRYDEGTLDQDGTNKLMLMLKDANMDLPTFRERVKAEASALSIVNPLIDVLQEAENNSKAMRKDIAFAPTMNKIFKSQEEQKIYEKYGVNKSTFYGDELYDIARRKEGGENVSIPTEKLIINQAGTTINQLGQTVVGGSVDVLQGINSLLENTFYGKNYLTTADEWYDNAEKFVSNFVPVPESDFVKDGNVNWNTALSNIVGTVADMALLIYGGGEIAKVAKSFGASQKASLLAGNILSGYLMTYDDHYKQAMSTGQLTSREAGNYASILATLEGVIESTSTPTAMKSSVLSEKILADVIKDGISLSSKGSAFSNIVKAAGKYASEMGFETAEEFEMMIAESFSNGIVNKLTDPNGLIGKFDDQLNGDEALATMILTPIATLGASAKTIYNTPLGNKVYNEAVFNTAVNSTWKTKVNDLIDKGEIDEATAKTFLADVDLMSKSISEVNQKIINNAKEKLITSFIDNNGRQPTESEMNDIVSLTSTILNSGSTNVDDFISKQNKLVDNGDITSDIASSINDKLQKFKPIVNQILTSISPTVITNASQKTFNAAKKSLNTNNIYNSAINSLVADDLKEADAIINSNDQIKDVDNAISEMSNTEIPVEERVNKLKESKQNAENAIGTQLKIDFGETAGDTEINANVEANTETDGIKEGNVQGQNQQAQESQTAQTTENTVGVVDELPLEEGVENPIDNPTPETPISNGIVIDRAGAIKFGKNINRAVKGIRNIAKKAFTNKYGMDKSMYDATIQHSADTAALKHRTDVSWKAFRKAAENHFGEKYEYLNNDQLLFLQNLIGNEIPDEVSSQYDTLVKAVEKVYGKKFKDLSSNEFNDFISNLNPANIDNFGEDVAPAAKEFLNAFENYVGKNKVDEKAKSFVNQQQVTPVPFSDFTNAEKDLMTSLFDPRVSLNALPEGELKTAAKSLRNSIDTLSDRLINSGALSDDLIAKLQENKGIYTARTYRIFGDKNFAERQIDILNDIITTEEKLSPYLTSDGKLKPVLNQNTNNVPLSSRNFITIGEKANAERIEAKLNELYIKDKEQRTRFNNINKALDFAEQDVINVAKSKIDELVDDNGNVRDDLTEAEQGIYDENILLSKKGEESRAAAYERVRNMLDEYNSKPSVNPKSTGGNKPNEASLKELGHIPVEYRNILGQYIDPYMNYINTMNRMTQVVTAYDMYNSIKDIGLKNGLFKKFKSQDAALAEGYSRQVFDAPTQNVDIVNEEGDIEKSFERIFFDPKVGRVGTIFKDIYTTPEVADAIQSFMGDNGSNVSAMSNIISSLNSLAKYNATVLNFQTMMVNFLANISGSIINFNSPFNISKSVKAIFNNETLNELNSDEIEKLKKLRVIGESTNALDISTVTKKINNLFDYFSRTDGGTKFKSRQDSIDFLKSMGIDSKAAAKMLDKFKDNVPEMVKFATSKMWNDLYKWGDEAWKINNYYGFLAKEKWYASHNRDMESNPFTDAEIEAMEKEAAKLTYDLTPSASNAMPITNVLRNIPIIAAFPTFAEQSIRTYYRGIYDGIKLLKSDNPRKRAVGLGKLLTTATLTAAATGLLDSLIVGDDDEYKKMEAIKALMPTYMKYRTVIPLGKSDSDVLEYEYFDAERYWMPTAATSLFRSIYENMAGGEDIGTIASETIQEFFSPFTGRDLLFGKIYDVIKNENPTTGQKIYNEAMTSFWDKDKWNYVSDAFKPGTVRAIQKIKDRYGKGLDVTNDVLGMTTGGRIMRVNPELSLKGKILGFITDKTDYNQYVMPSFKTLKYMSREDLDEKLDNLEAKIALEVDDIRETYKSAITLGLDLTTADDIVKAKGMNKNVSKYIISGDEKYIEMYMDEMRDKAYKRYEAAEVDDYDYNKKQKQSRFGGRRGRPKRPRR